MLDVQKVSDTKQRILSMISTAGPSFPARISRETNISPIFIGALLSEMVAEQKLVMSNMKVGSSPLYLLRGQETQLEKFAQYLNSKERETLQLLKNKQVLDDSSQDPATRVALRKIKDFAIPIAIKQDNEEKLFWKYFTLEDSDALSKISPVPKKIKQETEKIQKEKTEILKEKSIEKIAEKEITTHVSLQEQEEKKKPQRKSIKENKPSQFSMKLQDYLKEKNLELVSDLISKTKEHQATIRLSTPLGSQDYLLIAKDKKKLTEDDLALVIHKANAEKMPALLVSQGSLDKQALEYLENWKNLVKFEKLK